MRFSDYHGVTDDVHTIFFHMSSLFSVMHINEEFMHLSIRSSVNQFVRCELNRAVFITRSHATQGEEMIFLGPSRLVLQGVPLHLAPRPREFTPGPLECRKSSPGEGRKGLQTLSRPSASFHGISLMVLCPHFLLFP